MRSRSKINQDIPTQLTNTNIQIKKAVHKLNRLNNRKEFHTDIEPNSKASLEITLLPDVPVIGKIECKGLRIPGRIKFTYTDKVCIHIYVSLIHKEPSFDNAEIKYKGRPSQIVVDD